MSFLKEVKHCTQHQIIKSQKLWQLLTSVWGEHPFSLVLPKTIKKLHFQEISLEYKKVHQFKSTYTCQLTGNISEENESNKQYRMSCRLQNSEKLIKSFKNLTKKLSLCMSYCQPVLVNINFLDL